ncbi:hypothetical protein HZB60_05595 [candidate division KSB1 bacterium]|nr:hypothetical protein [candidate division KSB1 bacterium]
MKKLSLLFGMLFGMIVQTGAAASLGVTVTNFSFTPSAITLATGDTVVWTRSIGTHNVHHNVATPKFHNEISDTWTTYVWACSVGTGALAYICQQHPAMTGTVNVADITITAPNGGEVWATNASRTINWTSVNLSPTANVAIEMNRGFPGPTWEVIVASTPNDGTHSFNLTGAASDHARIRVRALTTSTISGSIADTSDADFSIVLPSVTVSSPNGGEIWIEDEVRTIQWSTIGFTSSVNIHLNRTFPTGNWELLASNTTNDGAFDWTVTFPSSTHARVRVQRSSQTSVADTSDADFTIVSPQITILTPNGGEDFLVGDTVSVTWTSQAISSNFHVDLNRDYPLGSWVRLFTNTAQADPHLWVTTEPTSGTCRMRVITVTIPAVVDQSDSNFSIFLPDLDVIAPDGGETYFIGDSVNISWAANGGISPFDIYLNRDFVANPESGWELILDDAPADTPQVWVADGLPSANCRVRVQAAFDSAIADLSNGEFELKLLTAPESLVVGIEVPNLRLAWPSVDGAGSYSVYRIPSYEYVGPPEFLVTTPDTFWVDTFTLIGYETYYYFVRAATQ